MRELFILIAHVVLRKNSELRYLRPGNRVELYRLSLAGSPLAPRPNIRRMSGERETGFGRESSNVCHWCGKITRLPEDHI
jgi:hypothetical protein